MHQTFFNKRSSRTAGAALDEELFAALLARIDPVIDSLPTRREKSWLVASVLFYEFGRHPSVALVRQLSGQGSMGDISEDLALWWKELQSRGRQTLGLESMPASVRTQIENAMNALWIEACKHGAETFTQHKQTLEARLAECELALESSTNEKIGFVEQLDGWRVRYKDLSKELLESQENALLLTKEIDRLSAKLSESEAVNAALIQQMEVNKLAQAQEAEKQRVFFEGEIRHAKQEIDAARQTAKTEIAALNAQWRDEKVQIESQRHALILERDGLKRSLEAATRLTQEREKAERRPFRLNRRSLTKQR